MSDEGLFSKLSDDVVLKIFFKLEDDPRNWARLASACTKFSSLMRTVCWKTKCSQTIPAVVADLLSSSAAAPTTADWAALHKLAVCCPGLVHSGVLLENSDFGLERELGPDENFQLGSSSLICGLAPNPCSDPSAPGSDHNNNNSNCSWSLFDDLYFDTVYNATESSEEMMMIDPPIHEEDVGNLVKPPGDFAICKRRKVSRSMRSHLATGVWNLSREQGNKLLASRFRGDCLYICDWPGCVHTEEKRPYMLFRGIFKNFKRSRVWRTINDGDRNKVDLHCAYCPCKQTWDLHSSFCLRRVFGYHDDGEPVVRAYVCENGHVSGAWTDWPLYT